MGREEECKDATHNIWDTEKANLIKELTEGYQIRKKEDHELTLGWDTTSGDGIENSS